MGTWGTSLYDNDSACDIRADYIYMLRKGFNNFEITKKLIEVNSDIMGDMEEEPLFWYALADTQWNYGRLLPEVKENALKFLSLGYEDERWCETGQKNVAEWKKTLQELKEKLGTPQPPEKRVRKYRIYQCKWKLGDVFAYRLSSDFSKVNGYDGCYIVFRKISESEWWPGHIIPVVQFYNWIGSDLPNVRDLVNMELLEMSLYPSAFKLHPEIEHMYAAKLLSTSERVINKENLIFLGNLQGEDIVSGKDYYRWSRCENISWEGSKGNSTIESYFLKMYNLWSK